MQYDTDLIAGAEAGIRAGALRGSWGPSGDFLIIERLDRLIAAVEALTDVMTEADDDL